MADCVRWRKAKHFSYVSKVDGTYEWTRARDENWVKTASSPAPHALIKARLQNESRRLEKWRRTLLAQVSTILILL